METNFEYTEQNGGACVTKILAPGAACVIPETLGGLAVTGLADRLFSGSPVEEIHLPKSLRRIGRYGFYNCERLKCLHFYGGVTEVGGGLFNGCGNVKELFVHMGSDGRSALRDFVTELSGRLTVHCFTETEEGREEQTARLIFPAYYDEAVENTPARLISFSIHGSGQRYRYCFEGRLVRYDRYDKQFFYEKTEEDLLFAAEIAMYRLMYPHGLWEDAKRTYRGFLKDHLTEILSGMMGEPENFRWLLKYFDGEAVPGGRLGAQAMERLITEAAAKKKTGLLSLLMELNHDRFAVKKKAFEL